MRPLRFPGRFRWWIVAVLAVIFGFPLFPLAAWLAWEMPPLQRYYLLNYLESTGRAKQPGTTTEVQWVYKTASGRKSTLATNPDVVSENSADPPVRLSEAAIAEGWTGIEKHAPVQVDSAQLEQFLQDDYYNGRGYWTLMLEPSLIGFALMMFLIAGGLQLKEWLGTGSRHEQRHGRRTRGPELLSSWRWNWKLKPDGIRWQLRWQNFLLDWCSKQLPSWTTPTFRMRRNLEANHILLMGDSGSGKSSAIRQILRQIAERGETAIVYDPALESRLSWPRRLPDWNHCRATSSRRTTSSGYDFRMLVRSRSNRALSSEPCRYHRVLSPCSTQRSTLNRQRV
jgi:hypothetical protein